MSLNGHTPAIRSGIFIMPIHDPAKPAARCYDEDLELIVRAESSVLASSGSASITR
jgi:hypothetical protein